MGLSGAAHVSIPKRRYLFVDAACLENGMRRFGDEYFGDGNIGVLYQSLVAGPIGSFDRVYYYDGLPIQEPDEDDASWERRTVEKRSILRKIETLDKFKVFEGDVRRKGGERQRREQKKVDVAITVDMLTHAFRRNMDEATLITGDTDFVPLLTALSLEGTPVTLWHPNHATAELKRAALIRRLLDPHTLWCLASQEFQDLNPVPHPRGGDILRLMPASLIREWKVPNGEKCALMEKDSHFLVRKISTSGNCLEMGTRSLRALLLYCRDQAGLIVPDELFELDAAIS